ncbi:MAG: FAD-dependent oxidoreductase [Propionibacteriaceae bacterium]|nr:FAD-dependent oxidoreductase [Propionibacteriaceae bacterium]
MIDTDVECAPGQLVESTGGDADNTHYDVLVVGSGIGGMESSIKLADMGYKVLLVEKEASVGGRMILLSKVFPTLDCASCISGPKMSSTINHPNITTMTLSEVAGIERDGDGFIATVDQKPKFVDWAACTGCDVCQKVCTVAVPDQFNADLAARRAAYIAFPQAVPKKAVLERAGTSPCIGACPAGIKAHGYVSLVRAGKDEEAFQLVLDATPLVGTLGRACYAPCEADCTRAKLEGPIPIRLLKRYAADQHYATVGSPDGPVVRVSPPNGKKIAVVGSGPAGLTAAWQLARRGYAVTILEKRDKPGGYLRYAIPSYRLPNEVVDADIANLTSLGVEIVCNTAVDDPAGLTGQGYDAVIVATGTQKATLMDVPGEDADGSMVGLDLLAQVAGGNAPDFTGRRVVVVGGGNVAMDVARVSRRLGAAEVKVAYRRTKDEMPAHQVEAADAAAEGVAFEFLVAPAGVVAQDGHVVGLRVQTMQLGEPDASGRRSPQPVPGAQHVIDADLVISAVGLAVDPAPFAGLADNRGRISVDPKTLQTSIPHLFAAGDVTVGATDITQAVGSGRRAAHMVHRWLKGQSLDGFTALDDRLETISSDAVLARQKAFGHRLPIRGEVTLASQPSDFTEVEAPLTPQDAKAGAGSCLDCGVCSECQECFNNCPAWAIRMDQKGETKKFSVGAVVVATGHKLFAADLKPEYGFGQFPNVITGMQMDRLLAPTRPFNAVLRPGDAKMPERIAYVSCTGSRDKTVGNPLCSKFCCMYSLKQNQLIMGALPLADVTMHYIDIRAAGKRYEEFYTQGKDMGAQYIKGRVAEITQQDNGDLTLRYEDIDNGGAIAESSYDLVVLAVGIRPNRDVEKLFKDVTLSQDEYFYVAEPSAELSPGATTIPGVFVAGTAAGAKDIVDTILHAGAAVAQVAAHLHHHFTQEVTA